MAEAGSAVRPPAPALRGLISHYAGFCSHDLEPGIDTALPSRHAHLLISLGAPIEVVAMPGHPQHAGRFTALVCGLRDAPAIVRRRRSFEGIHVFLRPLAVQSIFGVSAGELASHAFDLSELWGRRAADLLDQLALAATWNARFAVLDAVLMSALGTVEPPGAVTWAWRQLAATDGQKSIAALARDIGWSRPHLTGRFRAELGVTPKTAARIFRFEHACRLIRRSRPSLAEVAVACGYHDQAHLTREWRTLAGCAPGQWIARELPFVQDYELAGIDDAD